MGKPRKTFRTILLAILLGIAVGTVVSEILAFALPPGIPRDVLTFSRSFAINLDPIDLWVIEFGFSLQLTFSVLSILGVFVVIQWLKWSW